jgi:putative DNA methylase
MRSEADKRIGQLYPKVDVTAEMAKGRPDLKPYVGRKLTVIAWIWARTVESPNPAFAGVDVPLASTFMLSAKAGKEAYVEPMIEGHGYRFTVKVGPPKNRTKAKNGTSAGKRAGFLCIMSGTPLPYSYIREQGTAGHMGARLMAIVAEGDRGRVYLSPSPDHEAIARRAKPEWKPDTPLYGKCRVNVSNYGFETYGDLFTPRQLVALTTFSDLVNEARENVKRAALAVGVSEDATPLRDGGTGSTAYADAVALYLSFQVDQLSNHLSTICAWHVNNEQLKSTFARQALPMTWDYAETNPLSTSTGSIANLQERQVKGLLSLAQTGAGFAFQADAAVQSQTLGKVVSTDPPYYDNIGYADLSDFFYVWSRRSLRTTFPDLFATLAVPKTEELVATPYRHGSKEKAEAFFLGGMTEAMRRLSEQAHPSFPVTIYYAFKQADTEGEEGTVSTGWDTFLDAVIQAGFAITGTWPMRTEQTAAMKTGMNALASSIILVCRKRDNNAPSGTRREFVTRLKRELPIALAHLQRGNIAPVDLAQAAIGPGMAVFTTFAKVLDTEGKPLTVRDALAAINKVLDEALAEQEGDLDADSRFALAWFEQYGFGEGEFGVADVLARAKVTAVDGLVEAGIIRAGRGKVQLLRPEELPADWDPATDARLTAWEVVHHLIRVLTSRGEREAASLASLLGIRAEIARELAYRLYTVCERKKRASEALAYNGLVQSWPEIMRIALDVSLPRTEQGALFGMEEQ